jgi:hypothetical protein
MHDNGIAEQKTEYKPRNLRIVSLRTARRMLHVEDVLDFARVRVELWAYEKGAGATGHADAYLDVDTARVLAAFLAAGSLPEPIEEAGGGLVAGQLTARIFRAEEAEGTQNPIRITVTNGPGTRQPNGLISITRGAAVEKVQVLLSRMDARRIGLALAEHLQAWATHTYAARRAAGTWRPEPAESRSDSPEPDVDEPGGAAPGVEPAAGETLPAARSADVTRLEPGPGSEAEGGPGPGGEAEPESSLRYGNGAAVGEGEAEIQAFHAYVAAEKTVPVSVDALRSWVRRMAKARRP